MNYKGINYSNKNKNEKNFHTNKEYYAKLRQIMKESDNFRDFVHKSNYTKSQRSLYYGFKKYGV